MARSIIVSRKHANRMAIAAEGIAYHLLEISGVLFVLSEKLGTNPPNLLSTPLLYPPELRGRKDSRDAEHRERRGGRDLGSRAS